MAIKFFFPIQNGGVTRRIESVWCVISNCLFTMALSESEFCKLPIEDMWRAYSKLKVDKDAFDQLTLQLSTAISKIDKLERNILEMNDQLAITKNVNSVLKNSISQLQRNMVQIDQYGRRENVEISGVPANTVGLETKIIKLLKNIDVNVTSADIVACHPLKRKDTAIVRFQNRKHAELALRNAKRLKGKNTSDIWGSNCTNFLNVNLSPANMKMRWFCKKLKNAGRIYGFGVDNRGVWLKPDENSTKKRVELKEDIEKYVPHGEDFENFFSS